ncbi:MAG: type II toxin-antitoxin system VapC family toxin [Gammaproteobacteria bacterium]|nr:type II toxin-antitoxin system VapC family toxin [Gammaproteobacteria bacterium]
MSYYLDTSIIIPFYCPEPLSRKVEKILVGIKNPVISPLVEVEYCSAVARKMRMKEITNDSAHALINVFRAHVEKQYYCLKLLEQPHYTQAREWIASFATSLRTLDALHLAVCYTENLICLTIDKILAKSAGELRVKVEWVK